MILRRAEVTPDKVDSAQSGSWFCRYMVTSFDDFDQCLDATNVVASMPMLIIPKQVLRNEASRFRQVPGTQHHITC